MKERGEDYLFYSSPLPIGVVAELALHFVKSSKLDHYLSPLPIMDSRALFYRQRYETLKGKLQKTNETLKGEFPKQGIKASGFHSVGIKASAFHNRRLTQIKPRMDADKPFETLKGELQLRRETLKGKFQKTNEINQINQIGHKQKEVKGKLKTNNQGVKTNKKGGKKCGRR